MLLLEALEQESARVVLGRGAALRSSGLLLLVARERGRPGLARVCLGQVEVEDAVLCF